MTGYEHVRRVWEFSCRGRILLTVPAVGESLIE